LVLRALGLGDFLVAVPALRGLRRRFPGHRIVLAAPAVLGPLAERCGAVDEVLPTTGLDALPWPHEHPPEVAVNLHGVGPESHRALDATRPRQRIGLRAPGWAGPDWADVTRGYRHERERWCAVVEAFGVPAPPTDLAFRRRHAAADHVVIHPGAAYGAKRWPVERFAAVAAHLERDGHPVVVTGSPSERPLAHEVAALAGLPRDRVVAGDTDLGELADLVERAALVVCGDTGVAHLATAVGTASVVLFGPVPPDRWGPPPGGAHVVLTDAGRRRGDPFADTPDPALLGVGVDAVLGAACALLQARPPLTATGMHPSSDSATALHGGPPDG